MPAYNSRLLEQLGIEFFHDPEVCDYRLEVAVVFLLGDRDAAELRVARLLIQERKFRPVRVIHHDVKR